MKTKHPEPYFMRVAFIGVIIGIIVIKFLGL